MLCRTMQEGEGAASRYFLILQQLTDYVECGGGPDPKPFVSKQIVAHFHSLSENKPRRSKCVKQTKQTMKEKDEQKKANRNNAHRSEPCRTPSMPAFTAA